MNAKSFAEVFETEVFRNRKIIIDERLPQNCDFFLAELIKHCKYTIFHFNNDSGHFTSLLNRMNIFTEVGSVYDGGEPVADIIDDVWVGKKIFNVHKTSTINVYRSNTARTEDYYDFDMVVKIEPLLSGCSSKINGSIVVFARDVVYYDVKYKVSKDSILYFN